MIENLKSKFLEEEGYKLYKCPNCGEYYYGFNSNTCGEYPEVNYSFIDKEKKSFSLKDFIKLYNKFFEERDHKVIDRYPVVARWRDDLLLTIASIACFQPWVTSGEAEPPANPLVIHQPCFRFEDYREVGYTGRHSVAFTMTAHHAFNKYWKEEMLEYCYKLLTDELKIEKERISFKLSYWAGGGNAGECYEVIVDGLEVATLVLMHYVEDPNGAIEIKGGKYKEMPMRIIDTGYGAERFVWLITKESNVFEANYKDLINKLEKYFEISNEDKEIYKNMIISGKLEKEKIKKIAELYRLIDFLRVIVFLCSDAVVPSNKKEGYLLRLAIRNAYSILWKFTEKEDLKEETKLMFEWIKENLDSKLKTKQLDYTFEVLEIEKEKFRKLVDKFKNYDFSKIKDKKQLIKLYESEGLPIFYYQDKIPFSIDEIFGELTTGKIIQKKEKEKSDINIPENIPETKALYYENPYLFETEANILYEDKENKFIILDKTIFYPEGGGQPSDTGGINGKKIKYVKKVNNRILHFYE